MAKITRVWLGAVLGLFVIPLSGSSFAQSGDPQKAVDDAHAAMKRNPLMAVAIALGLGFLVGVLSRTRR